MTMVCTVLLGAFFFSAMSGVVADHFYGLPLCTLSEFDMGTMLARWQ